MTTIYMNWRVNYGNGQVHETATRAEAERLLEACGCGYAYVQRRGDSPSGWVRVAPKLRRAGQ